MAPTTSAWAWCPQDTQANLACVVRLSADTWPHTGQVRLVLRGLTVISQPPCHCILYSN